MAYTKGVPSASASADTDPRYSRINSLPAERVIMPYENDLSAIVDENFGYTLQMIAEKNITDASDACSYFENRLRSFM